MLFENISKDYSKNIFLLDINKWSFLKLTYHFAKFFIKNAKAKDHFHYPLNPLFVFHLFSNTSYSISLCHSSNLPSFKSKSKGLIIQRTSLKWAKNIDILNASLFKKFSYAFSKYIPKSSITPGGTYIRKINLEKNIKKDKFIFISRLTKGKGVERFLKLAPEINTYIKENYCISVPFFIFGEGILNKLVKERVSYLKLTGMDINYGGFIAVETILPSTKCIFSMQDETNYPSRIIAEALSYGCNVIASDVGDTREFGKLKGLFYYSTTNELFKSIDEVMNKKFNIKEISDSAIVRFSSQNYIDYFYRIFNEDASK